MRPRGFLFLLACICLLAVGSTAQAQWLEETIWLPDSLGGLIEPSCMLLDSAHNRLYVGGANSTIVVLDCSTKTKVARISVPFSDVRAMCYNPRDKKVYCAGRGWSIPGDSLVVVIDAEMYEVIATIGVGYGPSALLYNPVSNKVYCASGTQFLGRRRAVDSVVAVIDGETDSLRALIPAGEGAAYLALSPVGNKVYCGTFRSGGLAVIDGYGDSLLSRIAIPYRVTGLHYIRQRDAVYAVYRTDAWVVDCATDTVVAELDLNRYSLSSALDPIRGRLFMVYRTGNINNFLAWDALGDSMLAFVPRICSYDTAGICYNPTANKFYARTPLPMKGLVVFDCSLYVVADSSVETGNQSSSMCCDPTANEVYCGDAQLDEVAVVDGQSNQVTARVLVGARPCAMDLNPANRKLYAVSAWTGQLSIIDTETRAARAVISSGTPCQSLVGDQLVAYNPVANKAYWASPAYESNEVTVVDGVSDEVITRLQVGQNPRAVCYMPGHNSVYAVTYSGAVAVIDGASDSVTTRLTVGGPAVALAADSTNGRVYVCAEGQGIVVIDAVSNEILATLGYADRPKIACVNPTSGMVYVGNAGDWSGIVVIPGDTARVARVIHCGPVNDLAANPDHNKVYAAIDYPDDLLVIDCVTHTIARTFEDWFPQSVYYSPLTRRAYCVGSIMTEPGRFERTIFVLDGATDSVLARIPAPSVSRSSIVQSPRDSSIYIGDWWNSAVHVLRDTLPVGVTESSAVVTMPSGSPSLARNVLYLSRPATPNSSFQLFNTLGRKVMDLQPGDNDVRHLSPGVYFVRQASSAEPQASSVRKVILTR